MKYPHTKNKEKPVQLYAEELICEKIDRIHNSIIILENQGAFFMKNYDIHSAIFDVSLNLYEIHRIFSRMILVYNNENHRIDLELWKEIMDMCVNLEKNMEKLTDFFPVPEYDPADILEYSNKEISEMLTEAVDISREFLDDILTAADIFAEYSTFLGFYKNIPNNFVSLRRIVRTIEDYMSKRVC